MQSNFYTTTALGKKAKGCSGDFQKRVDGPVVVKSSPWFSFFSPLLMYDCEFKITEQKKLYQLTIKLNRNIYPPTHLTLKFSFLFVDAAKDFIPSEVVELLQKSTNKLIQELFRFQENQDKGDGKFEVRFLL